MLVGEENKVLGICKCFVCDVLEGVMNFGVLRGVLAEHVELIVCPRILATKLENRNLPFLL